LDNLDISSVEPTSMSFHQNLCNFDLLPRTPRTQIWHYMFVMTKSGFSHLSSV